MPAPHTLAAFTGALQLLAGAAILINRYSRMAAAWLGLWMVLLTLGIYLPIFLTASGGMQLIEGVNYVFDTLLFAGVILLLASAMPRDNPGEAAAPALAS